MGMVALGLVGFGWAEAGAEAELRFGRVRLDRVQLDSAGFGLVESG